MQNPPQARRFQSNHSRNNRRNPATSIDQQRRELPITERKAAILDTILKNQVVVLRGETGSGKSTQLPQYLVDDLGCLKVACTQPRRVAAKSLAKRVAQEVRFKKNILFNSKACLTRTTLSSTITRIYLMY